MKIVKEKTTDGKVIEHYHPENPEDEKRLREMVEKGEVEAASSFGDRPEVRGLTQEDLDAV